MAKSGKDATLLAASTIEKFHTLLGTKLSEVFNFDVTIEECGRRELSDWKRSRNPVSFILRVRDDPKRMRDVGRPGTRRDLVLQLEPDPNDQRSHRPLGWWIGWSEQWHPRTATQRQNQFAFHSAGWRLYCTGKNNNDTLLVRAEWDRPNAVGAAQPHWHFHHRQRMDVTGLLQGGNVSTDVQDDSPLTASPDKDVDTTRIHLGMGGWCNDSQHPKCWQFPLGDVQKTVSGWAIATLKYMQSQVCHVRLADAM